MKTLCYVAICMITFRVVFFIATGQHLRKNFSSEQAFKTARVSTLLVIAVGISLTLFSLLLNPRLVRQTSPVVVELASIGVMCVTMVALVLRSPDLLTKMQGQSIEEAFQDAYFSDSYLLLMIDGVVTGAHVGFPARWVSMLPLEVTSILLYAVIVFGTGGNEPMENSVLNLMLLLGLVTMSAIGLRANEKRERKHFLDIIKEKSLRCEAEFELSQTAGRERPRRVDQHSNPKSESLPSTSAESKAFELVCGESSDITEQLTRVMELGDAEHWRIKEEEVKLLPGRALGSGGYGQVVRGIFCGVNVAVKRPCNRLKASDLSRLPALCNELRVWRHVRHPNIAAIYGSIVVPLERKIGLVIEFIRGLSLDKFLTPRAEMGQGGQPDTRARYSIMLGVSNALLYLHTRCPHIVHGDVKASNVMIQVLGSAVHAKILDFGMSRVLTRHTRPLGGTLAYLAPEAFLREGRVKCSADIYSFGRLVTFIATSIPPLSDMTRTQIEKALKQKRPPPPIWPGECVFESSCRPLVRVCIQAEDRLRPSALEVHGIVQSLSPQLGLSEELEQSLEGADIHDVEGTCLPTIVEEPAHPQHEASGRPVMSDEKASPAARAAGVSL